MRPESKTGIGSQLVQIRETHGLTQVRLANIAGVSQTLISHVEKGKRELPLRAVENLVLELGLDAAALVSAGNPVQVLKVVAEAWSAYEEARATYNALAKEVSHLSELFEKLSGPAASRRQRALRRLLTQRGWQQIDLGSVEEFLTHWFRDRIASKAPCAKRAHPLYRRLPGGSLPEPDRLNDTMRLATAASRLSKGDLDLLLKIADRLGSTRQATSARPTQSKETPTVEVTNR